MKAYQCPSCDYVAEHEKMVIAIQHFMAHLIEAGHVDYKLRDFIFYCETCNKPVRMNFNDPRKDPKVEQHFICLNCGALDNLSFRERTEFESQLGDGNIYLLRHGDIIYHIAEVFCGEHPDVETDLDNPKETARVTTVCGLLFNPDEYNRVPDQDEEDVCEECVAKKYPRGRLPSRYGGEGYSQLL